MFAAVFYAGKAFSPNITSAGDCASCNLSFSVSDNYDWFPLPVFKFEFDVELK